MSRFIKASEPDDDDGPALLRRLRRPAVNGSSVEEHQRRAEKRRADRRTAERNGRHRSTRATAAAATDTAGTAQAADETAETDHDAGREGNAAPAPTSAPASAATKAPPAPRPTAEAPPAPRPTAEAPPKATDAEDAEDDSATKSGPLKRVRANRVGRIVFRLLIVVGVAVVVAALLRVFVVEPFYIPSESMEPTLHGCQGCTDDHVLVDKLSYRFESVKSGDIVVFHKPPNAPVPDDVLIKRVIATGGDRVQLRKSGGQYDGKVYVNGLALDESYVNPKCGSRPTLPLTSTTSWTIPAGEVFVMGDNRCESEDSRAFGPIKTSSVIGRAVLIIWPLGRFGRIH